MENKIQEEEVKGLTKEFVESEEAIDAMQTGLGMAFGLISEFNIIGGQTLYATPVNQDEANVKLSVALIQEELNELQEAFDEKDKVAQLDAYIDLFYVLGGAIMKSGMTKEFIKGFLAVHQNNMTKFVDGKALKNEAGKIIKPEGYKSINLADNFPYLLND